MVSRPSLANKTQADIAFVVVQENTENFFVGIGSRYKKHEKKNLNVIREIYSVKFRHDVESDAEEIAYEVGVVICESSRRVQTYALDLAMQREKKFTSLKKANVLSDLYCLWRNVFTETAKKYPDVKTDFKFVDALRCVLSRTPSGSMLWSHPTCSEILPPNSRP